jgi:hypothetical protein
MGERIGMRKMQKILQAVSGLRKLARGIITEWDGFSNFSSLAWANHGILSTAKYEKTLTTETALKRKRLRYSSGILKLIAE